MGKVLRVFGRDVMRLAKVPAAWSVVLFLVVLPSLYAWFNVAGFWNPYDNTSALTVCVVNEDAGASDETLGDINLGARLVDELKENDQLGWEFVDRNEAMDQVRSGKALAAFVIPEQFSRNVATVVSGNFTQPKIEYYVNEKVGPVAPKITDTGANALDTTINEAFFSTVSSEVAKVLNDKVGGARGKIAAAKSSIGDRVGAARTSVADARKTFATLAKEMRDASESAKEAQSSLKNANAQVALVSDILAKNARLLGTANSSLTSFVASTSTTFDEASALFGKSSAKTAVATGKAAGAVSAAKGEVDVVLERAREVVGVNDEMLAELEQVLSYVDGASANAGTNTNTNTDSGQPAQEGTVTEVGPDTSDNMNTSTNTNTQDQPLTPDTSKAHELLDSLEASNTKAANQIASLQDLSDDIGSAASSAANATQTVDGAVQNTLTASDAFRSTLSNTTVPAIGSGMESLSSTSSSLSKAIGSQTAIVDQAALLVGQLSSTLATTADALEETGGLLEGFENDIGALQGDLSALGTSGLLKDLVGEDGFNSDTIADFMMSPTMVQTVELYELNAYGTAMAPLFINLTLWIGVFMLMVILRLEVDEEGVGRLTIAQRYFGRWLLLAVLVSCQAVVCCAGCLALGVQTVNAPLFFLTAVIASLSYLSVQYTLSTTLQHVGKAFCIVLVFVQIPAATGLYPIEMTNDFFQAVYPAFPFTYGINAIRETTCGFYGSQWAQHIGVLLAFFAVFMAIGVLVRPYVTNLNRMFARQIAESDIVIGESVELPARRYRLSQIVHALSDREEFRAELTVQAKRFVRLYPNLKGAAFAAGVVVPVIATVALLALGVEKVVVLTMWLVWFVLIAAFLIMLEFARDHLGHLVSLDSMTDEEMRTLYAGRNEYTRVKPMNVRSAKGRHVGGDS